MWDLLIIVLKALLVIGAVWYIFDCLMWAADDNEDAYYTDEDEDELFMGGVPHVSGQEHEDYDDGGDRIISREEPF